MMKIIKIIGGLLIALVFIFLLAGLVRPEVKYTTEITVDKSVEEVFEKYNDLDNLKQWIPEVISIESISETPKKVGSKYKMIVESDGKKIEMIETVDEFIPNKKVAFSFDAGSMLKTNKALFEAEGTATQITSNHICKGADYLHQCMFAFFGPAFKKIDQGYMQQFKEWAEK